MHRKWRAPIALLAGLLLGAGITLVATVRADQAVPTLAWQQANLFAEIYELIRRDYVDEMPDQTLMDGAVRGMVGTLDKYSEYLDAEQYEEMRANTSGAYSGVGIEVSTDAGVLVVVSTMEDSPAARAGILPGDTIIAVDDVPVTPDTLNDAVDQMRGKPGERIKLTVRRGTAAPLTFELRRRKVRVHSVTSRKLEAGYGYIRISEFNELTGDDFDAALKALQSDGALRGLVLDLRDNPGGVLDAAVAVADEFLDGGTIVTAGGRAVDATFTISAQPGDVLHGAPLDVLVDADSASAAEIVAGALQDHQRARLLGQTTFGKGSVQTVIPLEQGGALKLTTSHYRTPSGAYIDGRGIMPDRTLPVAASPDDTDAAVRAALDDLKSRASQHPASMSRR